MKHYGQDDRETLCGIVVDNTDMTVVICDVECCDCLARMSWVIKQECLADLRGVKVA